jgi:hypothetical protein
LANGAPPWRTLLGWGLAALAAHAALLWWVRGAMADIAFNALPPPVYARVLAPAPPAPAAAAAPPAPRAVKPSPPARPNAPSALPDATAEASPAAQDTPTAVVTATPAPPAPAPTPATTPEPPVSAAAAPATASPAPTVASLWPTSTLLAYDVVGDFRGNLNTGSAQLDWRRDGDAYSSEMRTSVGIVRATWRSRGRLVGTQIEPERYEEQATGRPMVAVTIDRATRKLSFSAITEVLDKPEGVQDTATIFMQLVAQLSAEPGAFVPGRVFSYPVARPRGLRQWQFEVIGREPVKTALGEFNTWHLKRRVGAGDPRDISFQIWLAPQLQNLPVKVQMSLGAEDFTITMDITKAQQAQ